MELPLQQNDMPEKIEEFFKILFDNDKHHFLTQNFDSW